jgi:hypothetical protein
VPSFLTPAGYPSAPPAASAFEAAVFVLLSDFSGLTDKLFSVLKLESIVSFSFADYSAS